jgi:hypothetical protein
MDVKGTALYVFNAFFMSMRSKFVGEANTIHYFSVQWSPEGACMMGDVWSKGTLCGNTQA